MVEQELLVILQALELRMPGAVLVVYIKAAAVLVLEVLVGLE